MEYINLSNFDYLLPNYQSIKKETRPALRKYNPRTCHYRSREDSQYLTMDAWTQGHRKNGKRNTDGWHKTWDKDINGPERGDWATFPLILNDVYFPNLSKVPILAKYLTELGKRHSIHMAGLSLLRAGDSVKPHFDVAGMENGMITCNFCIIGNEQSKLVFDPIIDDRETYSVVGNGKVIPTGNSGF